MRLCLLSRCRARNRSATPLAAVLASRAIALCPKRRWGYYTLPVPYGDRLVARLDPRFERQSGRLVVNGFGLEDPATGRDEAFASALRPGMQRLAEFVGAQQGRCAGGEAGPAEAGDRRSASAMDVRTVSSVWV